MPETNLFLLFVRPLDALQIPYMVTGSIASIAYGEPRLTNGVDLVVEIASRRIAELEAAFPLDAFYFPPVEIVRIESERPQRGHFNIIDHATGFKADIYPRGNDPLNAWGLSQCRRFEIEGISVRFAPPEYVILRKLEYYREGGSEKHLRDIRGILETSQGEIHIEEVEARLDVLGVRQSWQEVLAK